MKQIAQDELHRFIVQAKENCYAGSGQKLLPYRQCSHDLQFINGDLAYHDSYFGESDFIGQEIVYHQGRVIWAMNYFGQILEPDRINAECAGQIIKKSLTAMYSEHRFLGGFQLQCGEYLYVDTSQGSLSKFSGIEWIESGGLRVYELLYHGGLIRS